MSIEKKPKKILIISSAETKGNIKHNIEFAKKLSSRFKQKIYIEWQNYQNIGLEIKPGKLESFVVSSNTSLRDFDVVYFKSIFRFHEQAIAIAESLAHNKVRFVGSELKNYIAAYKLTQLSKLARANINFPHTIYLPIKHYLDNYESIVSKLGEPFVFKAVDGSIGKDNYLIKDKKDLKKVVKKNKEKYFIAQQFIRNDSDLRIVVIEDKVKLIIKRSRKNSKTHLNNTSKGANTQLLPINKFPQELKKLSIKSAKLMNRDIAGVDVMLELDSNKPYILEVNASPQISTGAYTEEKLDVYEKYFKELTSQ